MPSVLRDTPETRYLHVDRGHRKTRSTNEVIVLSPAEDAIGVASSADFAGNAAVGVAYPADLDGVITVGVASSADLAGDFTVSVASSVDLAGDVTIGVASSANPASVVTAGVAFRKKCGDNVAIPSNCVCGYD